MCSIYGKKYSNINFLWYYLADRKVKSSFQKTSTTVTGNNIGRETDSQVNTTTDPWMNSHPVIKMLRQNSPSCVVFFVTYISRNEKRIH